MTKSVIQKRNFFVAASSTYEAYAFLLATRTFVSESRSKHRVRCAATALVMVLSVGCSKEAAWRKHSFSSREVAPGAIEVELPASLWSKIEGLVNDASASGGKSAEPEGSGDGPGAAKALPTEFAPVTVFLIEKNHGILKKTNVEIKFGPGGGEIDLADFVEPLNGSFYFLAEFMPEIEAAARRVYFLSNAVQRRVGNEKVGAGCNAYLDVTSAFDKALKTEGFLVNTQANRHVSALAGTYFFAAVKAGTLHLSSLSIRDSRHRGLHCKRR